MTQYCLYRDGVLNFAISIEDNELTATLPEPASAVPTQAPAPVDTGGGWGWGGLSSMVSSVASGKPTCIDLQTAADNC